MSNVLIIGGGFGGVVAAESLARRLGPDHRITLVSRHREFTFFPAMVRLAFGRCALAAGIDVMRINCAHDNPDTWAAMAHNLRQAERKLGRSCKILTDQRIVAIPQTNLYADDLRV